MYNCYLAKGQFISKVKCSSSAWIHRIDAIKASLGLERTINELRIFEYKVKLGNKELLDKEQIGIKEPFPVTK